MNQAPDTLRIAIAQLNPTVGDIAGNLALAREARRDAASQGADLVLFTELFLSGYSPEDLVLKPAFIQRCREAAEELAKDTADGGPGMIIGVPWRDEKTGLHNSVAVMDEGRIVEEGSHEALLAAGGLYAQFWARQSGGFLDTEAAE